MALTPCRATAFRGMMMMMMVVVVMVMIMDNIY